MELLFATVEETVLWIAEYVILRGHTRVAPHLHHATSGACVICPDCALRQAAVRFFLGKVLAVRLDWKYRGGGGNQTACLKQSSQGAAEMQGFQERMFWHPPAPFPGKKMEENIFRRLEFVGRGQKHRGPIRNF